MIDSKQLDKLNRDLNKIGEELNEAAMEVSGEVAEEFTIGANKIRNTIIKSMRDTKRAPWFYWRSKGRKVKKRGTGFLKSAKKHHPSVPGEPPAIDHGELVRSIMFDVGKMKMEIGSAGGAPYAEYLEGGTLSITEGGMVITERMDARPWLGPAVSKHHQDIIKAIGDGVVEMIEKGFTK